MTLLVENVRAGVKHFVDVCAAHVTRARSKIARE